MRAVRTIAPARRSVFVPTWDQLRSRWNGAARAFGGTPRRIVAALSFAVVFACARAPASWADPGQLLVTMDKALVLKYPPTTETIVVGNPVIADVTMVRNGGIVVLTGKSFGDTNIVFLDRSGTLLSESNLRVIPHPSVLYVQRGLDRESYSCRPRCEPAIGLGDATAYLHTLVGDVTTRNGAAVPTQSSGVAGSSGAPH